MSSRSLRLARILISALEDRISLLAKKYPSVPESTIRSLSELDPTKGSLLEWLVRQVKSGQFRFPEDSFRMTPVLSTFLKLKKSPRLLQQHNVSPDINKYSFYDLESLHDKISGTSLKTQRQTIEESKSQGAKTIYDTPPYKIIQIGGPKTDPKLAQEAACLYAKNTKWCTSQPQTASSYLENGPLYIIFKNGVKLAQTDGLQLMNVRDREIPITKAPNLWKLLAKLNIVSPSFYSYSYAKDVIKGPFPQGEPAIARDPEYSFLYVKDVLKAPFPMGEPAISQTIYFSYHYASNVLKAPFPLGEPAISQSTEYSLYYAKDILHAPFPLGEPAISRSPGYSYAYAQEVLKAPFPLGEPAISRSSHFSYQYARDVLQAPFPLGEPAISKDPEYSYQYAEDVLKAPFPLGEPAISKSPWALRSYEKFLSSLRS
jgi:hypothetical protein